MLDIWQLGKESRRVCATRTMQLTPRSSCSYRGRQNFLPANAKLNMDTSSNWMLDWTHDGCDPDWEILVAVL